MFKIVAKNSIECIGLGSSTDLSCDELESSLQLTPGHNKEYLPSNELKLDPSNFLQLPAENEISRRPSLSFSAISDGSRRPSSLGDIRSRSTISVFSMSGVSSQADLRLLVLLMAILFLIILVVIFIILYRPFFLYQQGSRVGLYLRM